MERCLNLPKLLEKTSYFLFGARGPGKSYLIRETLPENVDYINLLSSRVFLDLQHDPSALDNYITHKTVIIGEVQRVPELLNEVHRLIEEEGPTFLLTGGSARKLKKKEATYLLEEHLTQGCSR